MPDAFNCAMRAKLIESICRATAAYKADLARRPATHWRRHDGCCRGVADREGENMAGYHPSRRMHRTSLYGNRDVKTP